MPIAVVRETAGSLAIASAVLGLLVCSSTFSTVEHTTARERDPLAELEKKSCVCIRLPTSDVREIDPNPPSMVVHVPIDGAVDVAGKSFADHELDNLFRAAFQHDKTTQVVLKADHGVAHNRVVNLMKRAKAAGVTRLAIGTSTGN